jgi:two-component system cell cycle sensor histidine kinase/response regulator CckA
MVRKKKRAQPESSTPSKLGLNELRQNSDQGVGRVDVACRNIGCQGLANVPSVSHRAGDPEQAGRSEEKFARAFRSSPLAITISSLAEGRYLDVNDAFLEMIGYSREEVIGRTAHELRIWFAPEDRSTLIEHLGQLGRVAGFQTKFRTRSGDIRLTTISAELIELEDACCLLAITQDVTEARRLEEQLRQSQKMQAVGRLASGLAHDFSNMLSVIIGYSELLHQRVELGLMGKYVDEIRTAADRAASLTRQLLAFTSQQVLQPKPINLSEVVERTSQMLQPMMGDDIELICSCAPSLGTVRADPLQMEHVLMNLALNARDAMPEGGKLILETRNEDLDETFVLNEASFRPGPHVMLSVTDTGCGMDEQTRAHIFEPFFTTKAPGKGTGLGLSMVYGCISQSGGYIWLHSELGGGTTFKIYLPRVDESPVQEQANFKPVPIQGSETVLLVEDDESLRNLTTTVLESNGYTVLPASGGNEAIEVAKQYSGPIDLLLTDVVMHGINGSELAAIVKAFRADLKLLFISGYPRALISHHDGLETGVALVEKPFTTTILLTKMRMVLNSQ